MDDNATIAEEIRSLSSRSKKPVEFGAPVSIEKIEAAERELGLQFPKSYRAFVHHFGAAYLFGYELHGLSDDPVLGPDIIRVNKEPRRALPSHYLLFTDDGGDYVFCLDTSQMYAYEEYPVVLFGPGADGDIVAAHFLDFLRRASRGEALI